MTHQDRGIAPLYLAGFTTAFGAHGTAVVLGTESGNLGLSLLGLGLVLALYDVAEVILKPVFGALSDRVGAKPVIVGGLAAFAVASLVVLIGTSAPMLALARLAQGAAASAFSPAASAAVARLAGTQQLGRYFGRYGAWKSLGYVLGPLLGVGLQQWLGLVALYLSLGSCAAVAGLWALARVPALPVSTRRRYTVADLIRHCTERGFVIPTLLLGTTTAILGVAVGFVPVLASNLDLPPGVAAATVAVLALTSTVTQPILGRRRDDGQISIRTASFAAMALASAALLAVAAMPGAVVLVIVAAALGVTIGAVTPLAFAHLAASTPAERMGAAMGNAEVGRELGDAGGPLLIGAVAAAAGLPAALVMLAGISLLAGVISAVALRAPPAAP